MVVEGDDAVEKVRALLLREGTKAGDFLDVYFIQKKLGYMQPMSRAV